MVRRYWTLSLCLLAASTLHAQSGIENRTARMVRQRHLLQQELERVASPDSAHALLDAARITALKISYAESAAPFELASLATIIDPMTGDTLRDGSNGWTCLPVPGAPMCLDQSWMRWFDAIRHGTDAVDIDAVGIGYMLAGDQGGPNVWSGDNQGEPTADNDWVIVCPHLMLLSPDPAPLRNLPANPAVGGPFIMAKGTPFEHVMIPIYEHSVVMPYR
jgi:hypothetical protein